MRRRAFLALAGSAAATVAAAPYAPLVVGDSFEGFVADRLGIDEQLATTLLAGAKERLGESEYEWRATKFALALRAPVSVGVPEGARRRAVESLVSAMFAEPQHRMAYAERRPPAAACGGLRRLA